MLRPSTNPVDPKAAPETKTAVEETSELAPAVEAHQHPQTPAQEVLTSPTGEPIAEAARPATDARVPIILPGHGSTGAPTAVPTGPIPGAPVPSAEVGPAASRVWHPRILQPPTAIRYRSDPDIMPKIELPPDVKPAKAVEPTAPGRGSRDHSRGDSPRDRSAGAR